MSKIYIGVDFGYNYKGDTSGDYFVSKNWYSGGLNKRYFHSMFGYIKDKRIRICLAQKEMNDIIRNKVRNLIPLPYNGNVIESISKKYDLEIDEVFKIHTKSLKRYIKC